MPGRLIGIIVFIAILIAFIGFNVHNVSDISLGVVTFSQVPIYLVILISFGLGLLAALPSVLSAWRYARRRQHSSDSQVQSVEKTTSENPPKKKKKNKKDEENLEDGSYGVD
jgi:hypothetical protein